MFLLFLFLVFGTVSGKDYVLEALQESIDWNSDPCEDFFRHVCPLNKPVKPRYDKEAINENLQGYWNWLQIAEDFPERPEKTIEHIAALYKSLCQRNQNTTDFLQELELLVTTHDELCTGEKCLDYLNNDPDCERGGFHLQERILRLGEEKIEKVVKKTYDYFVSWTKNAKDIAVFEKNDLYEGVSQLNSVLEDMKKVASDWISKTPWVINNHVEKLIQKVVDLTVLRTPNVTEHSKETFKRLIKIEGKYRECKENYENIPEANTYCFYYAGIYNPDHDNSLHYFDTNENAFNVFPTIIFGLPFIYEMQHTQEMALGDAGRTLGHELGHSIIAGKDDAILTYFSENSADCVFEQYNTTCNEFKEISCTTGDYQQDENGADILGTQLAYHLLEEYYKDTLHNIYEPLNVTYQQLFFYSSVFLFCQSEQVEILYDVNNEIDTHSSHNVRVNAMVQHPGFQEAFKCSDDSRMMKSAMDQCIIYGENAPAIRRKK